MMTYEYTHKGGHVLGAFLYDLNAKEVHDLLFNVFFHLGTEREMYLVIGCVLFLHL